MAITDTYLKHPDHFPEPAEVQAWGDDELWIDFVGGPYHVTGLNESQKQRLAENFAEVCIENPTPEICSVPISVCRLSAELFQPPAPPPRLISFDLQPEPNFTLVAGESLCGRIECAAKTTGTLWTASDDSFFTRNVFENFFRILVTYRLLEEGGMLLHSAGIVSHGHAFLFPGRSGNGKSTLSRLSLKEGRTVLSDDMNALTWREGKPWVEKVPFTGDLGRSWTRSSSYPLRAILALEKSTASRIHTLEPVSTVALMVACAPYLNGDPFRLPRLLESLEKLTATVPTHILSFALEKGVWPLIMENIKS